MTAIERRRGLGPVELATLEAGEGGRPLLLVHGFTGAKEDFADWLEPFAAEGWWVVAPDLRGHGASSQPAEEAAYSLSIYADDLQALAADLGWGRFDVLGHSMGGMVSQELVLRDPTQVGRLVLMDTSHGPFEGLDADTVAFGVEVIRTQGLPALLDLLAQLPQRDRTPAEQRVRDERPGYVEFGEAKLARSSGAMYAAMGQELTTRADRLAELAALPMPVLVVVGDQDRDFLAPSHRLAAAIDTATLAVIADAAHCPQFEHPEAWWRAVSSFLAAPG